MGYTIGRKLTPEVLEQIAKKYKSRGEFQLKDSSAYVTARKTGLLDSITKHMKCVAFSIPQMVCRDIFDGILKSPSKYNTRKVVPPYEVDIFYPNLNLAVEYNGKGWHIEDCAIQRDTKKKNLLKDKGIFVLTLVENNRDYENDIKKQICSNAEFLDKFKISAETVRGYKIHWDLIYQQTTIEKRIKDIELIVKNCIDLKEFREKFRKEYDFIIRYKLNHLLKNLIKRHTERTKKELLDIASRYTYYSDFVKTKYYFNCQKRGILQDATKHMKKDYIDWSAKSNEEIVQLCKNNNFIYSSDAKKIPSLRAIIKKRGINVWKNRKCKHKPEDVKLRIENILASGVKFSVMKKQHSDIYQAFLRFKKKGMYN